MPKAKEPQFMQIMDIFTNQFCPVCTNYLSIVDVVVENKEKHSVESLVFIKLKCLRCSHVGLRELVTPKESF